MKKADFEKLKKPKPRSKSRSRRSRSATNGNNKEYFIGAEGKKIPKDCRSYLNTGTCEYEKNKPGKECIIPHLNQDQYKAKFDSLNSS